MWNFFIILYNDINFVSHIVVIKFHNKSLNCKRARKYTLKLKSLDYFIRYRCASHICDYEISIAYLSFMSLYRVGQIYECTCMKKARTLAYLAADDTFVHNDVHLLISRTPNHSRYPLRRRSRDRTPVATRFWYIIFSRSTERERRLSSRSAVLIKFCNINYPNFPNSSASRVLNIPVH